MKKMKVLRDLYLKEKDDDLEEYPDFDEVLEVIEETFDSFLSMLENLSDDLDSELDDDFYTTTLSRVDGDYERFLTSLKSFLTLLKLRSDRDSE